MSKLAGAVQIIEDAIEQFKPSWVFALFSGGHDSLTASYVASLASQFDGCIHINTGTGIPATRQFVVDTCTERDWSLFEFKSTDNCKADWTLDPMDYEQIVLANGFPGPSQHTKMYVMLKERCLRMMERQLVGKIMLISGARAEESKRRMGKGCLVKDEGKRIWVNPIWDWLKSECSAVLTADNFKRNQAALRFGRSGECCCGAFAEPGELAALRFADPAHADWLEDLERRVRAAGFPWGWEDPGPPDWWKEKNQGQTFMFGYDEDETLIEEHLCTSCKWRAM